MELTMNNWVDEWVSVNDPHSNLELLSLNCSPSPPPSLPWEVCGAAWGQKGQGAAGPACSSVFLEDEGEPCPALIGILGTLSVWPTPVSLCPNGMCLPFLSLGNKAWRGALRKCPLGLDVNFGHTRVHRAWGRGLGGKPETDKQFFVSWLIYLGFETGSPLPPGSLQLYLCPLTELDSA